MKEIPLTKGLTALVDDVDFNAANEFTWHSRKVGRVTYAARAVRKLNGCRGYILLHQFLMPGVKSLDHKDGNGLNNQRENLRPASKLQNARAYCRKKRGATSAFRGVCWSKQNKNWKAQCTVAGEVKYLGSFDREEDAARAYDDAARVFFGEFASPNFPA